MPSACIANAAREGRWPESSLISPPSVTCLMLNSFMNTTRSFVEVASASGVHVSMYSPVGSRLTKPPTLSPLVVRTTARWNETGGVAAKASPTSV